MNNTINETIGWLAEYYVTRYRQVLGNNKLNINYSIRKTKYDAFVIDFEIPNNKNNSLYFTPEWIQNLTIKEATSTFDKLLLKYV